MRFLLFFYQGYPINVMGGMKSDFQGKEWGRDY